jgi:hypothetical protein
MSGRLLRTVESDITISNFAAPPKTQVVGAVSKMTLVDI